MNAERVDLYHKALFNGNGEEAGERLLALLRAPHQEWRKAEDALPPHTRACFVWRGAAGEAIGSFYGDGWRDQEGGPIVGVTHWQPVVFPDPPQ